MESKSLQKRKLPKLMACMTKGSLENFRNKTLFSLDLLDERGIRRRKKPLHECVLLELNETGFVEAASYFGDLLRDNAELLAEDEIGIVVDLKKNNTFLEHIAAGLQQAEIEMEKGNTKKECLEFLNMAMYYSEKGKGILWLAEKLFVTSIAVGSKYMIDGGRQKGCCKYHYSKFILDKFPGADTEEPFTILTEVRDNCIGKNWPLYEGDGDQESDSLFRVTAIQLHRVLLAKARKVRKSDPAKSERLSRLAERRAVDADDTNKIAEAVIEIGISQLEMNSLQNAMKTFTKALSMHLESHNVEGICEARMHLAAVMQKLGNFENASKMLTEMGALAMEQGLRRHLGRALHLLGELQLKREHPELGTEYLREAFACFMGFNWQQMTNKKTKKEGIDVEEENKDLDEIYESDYNKEVFVAEAEQSRLTMAISSGQEHMSSYFNILKEANTCSVAQSKIMDWKLSNAGWWVKRMYHDFISCTCPKHNRTPMDVLRAHQEVLKVMNPQDLEGNNTTETILERTATVNDLRALRSSMHKSKFTEIANDQ